jgi:hypothetical protein
VGGPSGDVEGVAAEEGPGLPPLCARPRCGHGVAAVLAERGRGSPSVLVGSSRAPPGITPVSSAARRSPLNVPASWNTSSGSGASLAVRSSSPPSRAVTTAPGPRRPGRGGVRPPRNSDRKVRGIIRGFETTVGDEHGFHPHYHVFLLVEGEITAVGAREALMPAGDRWCERLAEHGLTAVAAVNGESAGFDVTVMDDAEAGTLARYPFKLALEAAVRETAFGGVFSAAAAPTLTATCWASGTHAVRGDGALRRRCVRSWPSSTSRSSRRSGRTDRRSRLPQSRSSRRRSLSGRRWRSGTAALPTSAARA